jgi:hypothetical protein
LEYQPWHRRYDTPQLKMLYALMYSVVDMIGALAALRRRGRAKGR